MKNSILFIFLTTLIACKPSEGIDNDNSNLRTDGFYMAQNMFATAKPDTINGMLITRNSMQLLRFYDLENGVIIPETCRKILK